MNVSKAMKTQWTLVLCLILSAAVNLHAQQRTTGRTTGGGTSGTSSASQGESYKSGQVWEALIQTDVETGSLIIITDDETNEHIQKIIENIDKPVPQVLIKVVFLEVTHRDGLDFGVEGSIRTDGTASGSIFESVFGLASATDGGFYRLIEDDVDVTLRALAEVGKMEVLSRPSILARHNQEAIITVGQEVPFVRNSRVTTDGQTINTVEYEDIGIILRVTPYITSEGLVEMIVAPEISTLTGETVPISDTIDAPVFAKRSAETRVVLPDQNTVVIGGLMQDNKTETVRKIPLLGDIPFLGMAFRRTIKEDSKTELLIFLTPHIVTGSRELVEISAVERDQTEIAPQAFPREESGWYTESPLE